MIKPYDAGAPSKEPAIQRMHVKDGRTTRRSVGGARSGFMAEEDDLESDDAP